MIYSVKYFVAISLVLQLPIPSILTALCYKSNFKNSYIKTEIIYVQSKIKMMVFIEYTSYLSDTYYIIPERN